MVFDLGEITGQDPSDLISSFEKDFFLAAESSENEICEHKNIHKWSDGRGYCKECGENFTDIHDLESTLERCQHPEIIKDDNGSMCTKCKTMIELLDSSQEWRFYGDGGKGSKNPSRCQYSYTSARGIKNVFIEKNIDIPDHLINITQEKYDKVARNMKNKVIKGDGRCAIIACCLFYAYQDVGQYRTASYIRDMFGITKKKLSSGFTCYYMAIPEDRTREILPENLIPWLFDILEIDNSHYKKVLLIMEYMQIASKLLKRSNPYIFASSCVFFYFCLNPKYKQELNITKMGFCKKVCISNMTLEKIVKDMTLIANKAMSHE